MPLLAIAIAPGSLDYEADRLFFINPDDDRDIATLNMANGFTRDCDVLNWREDQSSRV